MATDMTILMSRPSHSTLSASPRGSTISRFREEAAAATLAERSTPCSSSTASTIASMAPAEGTKMGVVVDGEVDKVHAVVHAEEGASQPRFYDGASKVRTMKSDVMYLSTVLLG